MSVFLKHQLWTVIAKYHEGKPCLHEHVLEESKGIVFSTYKLRLNLLTYMKGYLWKEMTVIGIPLSISEKGYQFQDESGKLYLERWIKEQKGFVVVLNGDNDLGDLFTKVYTLPTVCLENQFSSFEAYIKQLRAHYRYRVKKALKRFYTVEVKRDTPFTQEMYGLYEAVYEKSRYKLEKSSYEYFNKMEASLDAFYDKDKLLGFCQYKQIEGTLYFLFCGIAYNHLESYDTYYNMLLYMIKRGIEEKVEVINFGQTTEDIKQKLGGTLHARYMYIYHSKRGMRRLVKWIAPKVGYSVPKKVYHVFKEEVSGESTPYKTKS